MQVEHYLVELFLLPCQDHGVVLQVLIIQQHSLEEYFYCLEQDWHQVAQGMKTTYNLV